MKTMKIGLQMGYWGAGPPPNAVELVTEADRLGYDSVWTAESYGSDALTPLAWWGSQTERVRLGTSLCQLSARTPTAMAMAAQTMDHLSGGRFVLGLGVSGPQVVEGWYGQPFPAPLARTREYVDIVRQVLAREKPVTNDGPHYPLPVSRAGPDWASRSSRSCIRCGPTSRSFSGRRGRRTSPWRPRSPTAGSPSSSPRAPCPPSRRRSTRASPGPTARRSAADFEVLAFAPTVISDDIDAAADGFRPYLALYIGGMGAKEMNFHFDVFARMGYEEAATKIQDAYLDGRKDDAAAAVPTAMVEEIALVGPGGEDPRRPRSVARVACHHHAHQRRRRHAAHHGRARARLVASRISSSRGGGFGLSDAICGRNTRIERLRIGYTVRPASVDPFANCEVRPISATGIRRNHSFFLAIP